MLGQFKKSGILLDAGLRTVVHAAVCASSSSDSPAPLVDVQVMNEHLEGGQPSTRPV